MEIAIREEGVSLPDRGLMAKLRGKLVVENGYRCISDPYLCGENELIFNRSSGAESNFFVFAEVDRPGKNLTVRFTNPYDGPAFLDVPKDRVIISLNATSESQIPGIVEKILYFSRFKDTNVYRAALHSHLGYVDGKALWGDGITDDKDWMRQTMFWNYDIHALTEHNWTQSEKLLSFLDQKLSSAGIVFVPGWENTTTVYGEGRTDPEFKSPHILVYCKDIRTAMDAKEAFLKKKIEGKPITTLTPVLCGVPWPFDEHIAFLESGHIKGDFALIVAHPSSHLPGVDILDPGIIAVLGFEKIWSVLRMVDGVEMYNPGEGHGSVDYDMSDKIDDENSEVAKTLSRMLADYSLNPYLSPPMVNYMLGLWAEDNKKFTIFGHDDHSLPGIGTPCAYGYGHTCYMVGPTVMAMLRAAGRKPTSSEFVQSIALKAFPGTEEAVSLRAFGYVKMTPKGPVILDARRQAWLGSLVDDVSSFITYSAHAAKLQLEYMWLRLRKLLGADVKVADLDEVAKELRKNRQKSRHGAKPSK